MEVDRLKIECGTLGAEPTFRPVRPRLLVFCTMLFAMPWTLSAMAATCYINGVAGGSNTGVSWTDAYTDLQSGLLDSNCTEIWVAQGVYKPVVPVNAGSVTTAERSASFKIKAGVAVYGGFAGGEISLAARDPISHVTIFSGDLDNNDDANNADSNSIDETSADITGSNTYHIVLMDGTAGTAISATTVLDGFTVTGGDSTGNSNGGALWCRGNGAGKACSPTLARLTFSGNKASNGGAAVFDSYSGGSSNATLTNVYFRGNSASTFGGAMYNNAQLGGTGNLTLTKVTFSGNSATYGGAMCNDGSGSASNSNPILINATFSGNTASSLGGAMFNNGGGGTSSPILTNVTFSGNSASAGGAMYNSGPSSGHSSPVMNNVIFWGDSATGSGQEIFSSSASGGTAVPVIYYGVIQGGCPNNGSCSNLISGDPLLGALSDNGGFAPTFMPGTGSAAINAVQCYLTPYTDQRDAPRPDPASAGLGKGCDLGAVEAGSVASDSIFVDGFGALQYH